MWFFINKNHLESIIGMLDLWSMNRKYRILNHWDCQIVCHYLRRHDTFCETHISDKIEYRQPIEHGSRSVYLNVWNDIMCEVRKVNWLTIIKKKLNRRECLISCWCWNEYNKMQLHLKNFNKCSVINHVPWHIVLSYSLTD